MSDNNNTTTTTTTEEPDAKRAKVDEEAAGAAATAAPKDFEVPLAAINKILKAALPDGANCTKDAKSAFSKAAGIFILYITACANDLAKSGKRSTINSQDIMTALTELGYASFIPQLEITLEKMKNDSIARKVQKTRPKKSDANAGEEEEDAAAAAAGVSAEPVELPAEASTTSETTAAAEPIVGALALL